LPPTLTPQPPFYPISLLKLVISSPQVVTYPIPFVSFSCKLILFYLQPTLTPQPPFYPIILLRPIIFSPQESIFPIPSAFSFCRLYQSY
jgi:hypothetical protein